MPDVARSERRRVVRPLHRHGAVIIGMNAQFSDCPDSTQASVRVLLLIKEFVERVDGFGRQGCTRLMPASKAASRAAASSALKASSHPASVVGSSR